MSRGHLPSGQGDRIDSYVAAVRSRLPGPRRVRADLMAELRDGLTDAAEVFTAAGADPIEAERCAVRDAGDPIDVAAAFREELAARQGRRTAWLLAITTPALLVAWDLVWRVGGVPSSNPDETTSFVARTLDVVSAGAAAIAVVALVAVIRSARRPAGWLRIRAVVGLLVAVGLTSVTVTGVGWVVLNVHFGGRVLEWVSLSPMLVVLSVVSVVVSGWQVWSLLCSLRFTVLSTRMLAPVPGRTGPRTPTASVCR